MTYNDCERCGSAVIDKHHRCLPSVRMRYQEAKAKKKIDALQFQIIQLEKLLAVTDATKLALRLDIIEGRIDYLLEVDNNGDT